MNNNDLKRLLDESLKPLQEGLNEVRTGLSEVRKDLDEVKQDLKEVKETQEERVLPSVIYVETTVKSYADRYIANEDHIGRLDKRLVAVSTYSTC